MKSAIGGAARVDVFAGRVELGAVARRDDDRFARRVPAAQRLQGVLQPARLEIQALPEFDRARSDD